MFEESNGSVTWSRRFALFKYIKPRESHTKVQQEAEPRPILSVLGKQNCHLIEVSRVKRRQKACLGLFKWLLI